MDLQLLTIVLLALSFFLQVFSTCYARKLAERIRRLDQKLAEHLSRGPEYYHDRRDPYPESEYYFPVEPTVDQTAEHPILSLDEEQTGIKS